MNADSGTDALTGQRDDPFHVERGPKQQEIIEMARSNRGESTSADRRSTI
jgi:hypothetical protein